jgi:L-fuconolactonase
VIVDSHVHVVAPDIARYPLTPRPLSGQWYLDAPCSSERFLEEMAGAGVDRAVLVQAVGAYTFDNAYAADSAAARPDRFASAACIDPQAETARSALDFWNAACRGSGSSPSPVRHPGSEIRRPFRSGSTHSVSAPI